MAGVCAFETSERRLESDVRRTFPSHQAFKLRRLSKARRSFTSVSGVPAICIGGPTTGSNEKEWNWKRGGQSGPIKDSRTMRFSLRIPTDRFSDGWLNVEINWQPGVPAGVEKRSIRPKDFVGIVAFGDALDGACTMFRQA